MGRAQHACHSRQSGEQSSRVTAESLNFIWCGRRLKRDYWSVTKSYNSAAECILKGTAPGNLQWDKEFRLCYKGWINPCRHQGDLGIWVTPLQSQQANRRNSHCIYLIRFSSSKFEASLLICWEKVRKANGQRLICVLYPLVVHWK